MGVAHPYSFGWPFAQGCRFEMTITDYSCCDFIEIFNNPEPLHEVNEKGVKLWEDLVLSGENIAATCGMDLHGNSSLHGHYSTYIEGEPEGDVCQELSDAIHHQRTWVCKGPLLEVHNDGEALSFTIHQTGKPGYEPLHRGGLQDHPPHQRSAHHLWRIRPDPADFFQRKTGSSFRCFLKKKPSSKTWYAQAR